MLVIGKDKISTDHVMWQPAFRCEFNCHNCYVSKSPASSYSGSLRVDLYSLLFIEKKLSCSQFTISLDTTLDPDPGLVNLFKELWTRYDHEKNLPDLCLTIRDYDSLKSWASLVMGRQDNPTIKFLSKVDTLSLSCMPKSDWTRQELRNIIDCLDVKLHYNAMISGYLPVDQFDSGVKLADKVYLTLEKDALGSGPDAKAIERWFESRDRVPKEKLIEDSCMQDTVINIKSGLTCGAGTRKLHVWPDGSVTGCPYDSYHLMDDKVRVGPVDTWENIQRIVHNRNPSPMDYCGIPKVFRKVMERSKK